jgi:DNA processing protein
MLELHYLLFLLKNTNLVFRPGRRIFDFFPDIGAIFSKNADLSCLKLTPKELDKIKNPDWDIIETDLRWGEQQDHHIITVDHESYPQLLKEIDDPPLLLFVVGDLELLQLPQIAIVGSRNPTPIGVETAFNFAQTFAESNLVVTSGLAIGIDAASHRGAVSVSGKTVAVLGSGLNSIYPKSNIKLAQNIIDSGGALVSEFPLQACAESWHFPLRNRIISGLSIGTLVVEAAMRSGSLITAKLAAKQGREVFAIPNSIYNQKASGCHSLIRQGAKLVEHPLDVLEEFPEIFQALKLQNVNRKNTGKKNKLDCRYSKLLDCMGFEMATIDVLATRMNLPISQVGELLLELEMQGLIKAEMGGYIKIGDRF